MKKNLLFSLLIFVSCGYMQSIPPRAQTGLQRGRVNFKAVGAALASSFVVSGSGIVLAVCTGFDPIKTAMAASIIASWSVAPRVLEWVKGRAANRAELTTVWTAGILVGGWAFTSATLISRPPTAFI